MQYLYETHLHTIPASACSTTQGQDYIKPYIDAGYAGIMVTDHFLHGNCGIDRSLPWREFVNRFCEGYENARNEGEKHHFSVFFGWEETFDGDDYLVYGLDKSWLFDHPEVKDWTRKTQYTEVHKYGGCVVQAHPFREAYYIHGIHLNPYLVDAVEGFNAGNQHAWNIAGMHYAQLTGLPITAGSDNHHADQMCKDNLAGVIFNQPLTSLRDYIDAILTRKPFDIHLPHPLPEWDETVRPGLPAFLTEADGTEHPVDAISLLSTGFRG